MTTSGSKVRNDVRIPAPMPRSSRLWAALKFIAPLALLLLLWELLIRAFGVSPRVSPDVESVARAGFESIHDGSLLRHTGASLWRVAIGTVLAIVIIEILDRLLQLSPIQNFSPVFAEQHMTHFDSPLHRHV